MLEGLEISVLNLSEVYDENYSFRFDSEYVKKIFLNNIIKLTSIRHSKLNEHICHMSGGATPLGAEYHEIGIPFLRVQNIMQNFFNLNDVVFLNSKQDEEIKRSRLKLKDVLLTITGVSYGKSATVNKHLVNSNINQHSVKITLKDSLNPYFLSTFLNSYYGKTQSDKNIVGVTRPALDYTVIKNFIIPNLELSFQQEIEELIIKFEKLIEESKQAYTQAEKLLLKEIGLQDFTPSVASVNIKSFKESFATSGRLDAEYYQLKYDAYLKLIKDYSNGSETIATICNLNGKNFKPEDERTYNYIELSNVGKSGDINGCTVDLGKELPSRARRKVNTDDVIISSIEGSLDSCALVTKEYNNALCSTGFYVINSDFINSESLLVLFKSDLMQNILKQNCSGTILTGLNKDDFLNIRIPKIVESKQQEIAELIEESFSLKKQSEHLLAIAKKAVEIAIEENENVALDYIEKETNE